MSRVSNLVDKLWIIAVEFNYMIAGIFFSIALPFMNYCTPTPRNSLMAKIRFPLSIYTVIIGLLYLISGIYVSKRKKIGLKLGLVTSILGIFLLFPLVMGLMTLYLFRPSIKKNFS